MVNLLESGRRDRQIIIEQGTQVQDSAGEITLTWATWATVWANVRMMQTRDRFTSQAEHSTRVATFFVLYLPGIDEKMRISYEGQYYQIKAISEMGRRQGHEILAEVVL